MKKPIPLALLTFIPVVLLALFRPGWLTGTALIVLVMVDVIFFRNVAYRLRDLARETAAIPYRLRYPFFPFLAGILGYGAISFGYVSPSNVPVVAIVAAGMIVASKLWISRGPLWPYAANVSTA